MAQDDFEPVQFRGLTLEEQIAKCRVMAAEAESFAAVHAGDRDQYLELAAKWCNLAAEMEQVLHSRESEA